MYITIDKRKRNGALRHFYLLENEHLSLCTSIYELEQLLKDVREGLKRDSKGYGVGFTTATSGNIRVSVLTHPSGGDYQPESSGLEYLRVQSMRLTNKK